MVDSEFKDPAELWRDMIGQWEKGVNALATQFMGTGEFSREANRVMAASLQAQKGLQELMGRYFDALNLPTKPDIDGLGERLAAIEDELGRLNDAIGRLAGTRSAETDRVPRVPRTKRYVPKPENEK